MSLINLLSWKDNSEGSFSDSKQHLLKASSTVFQVHGILPVPSFLASQSADIWIVQSLWNMDQFPGDFSTLSVFRM